MAEEKEKIKIKLLNVRHPFNEKPNLTLLVSAALGISEENVMSVQIIRRSVDARQERLAIVYTLAIEIVAAKQALGDILKKKDVEIFQATPLPVARKIKSRTYAPIIIGCGPSGLFAALTLIERGARPILIERVPTLLGHGLVNRSLRALPAPTVGLFMLGEPVAAGVLAYWVFGERAGAWALAGGAVILAALALVITEGRA